MHFRDGDPKSGLIELKRYHPKDIMAVTTGSGAKPFDVEPPVPFKCIAAGEFRFSGFTHFVLAQSPRFTPPAADRLLEFIREYMTPA
jgi:hypothetical protein